MTFKIFSHISREFGVHSLVRASRDVKLLILIKVVRMIAFGQSSIFLVQFFHSHGYPTHLTGAFMSCTLVGDVVISYFLTMNADRLGRRRVLIFGALLMAVPGIIFAVSNNFYVLLLAAILGVISPSGADIGPFKAIEESTLAHLVPKEHRNEIYAWYSFSATLATAFGNFSSGAFVNYLTSSHLDLSLLSAYKLIFVLFAFCGALKLVFSLLLSNNIETEEYLTLKQEESQNARETLPLLNEEIPQSETSFPSKKFSLLPNLSSESTAIVIKLSLLFALDSFASSLVQRTWMSYYISKKFSLSPEVLGSTFFSTGIISAFTMLVSSSIAKRLGPVLTMSLTHLPSSLLLGFIPLPSTFIVTFAIFIFRSCTSHMNIAPRQAFLSMVVKPSERTAVMGWTNVVRTNSQIFGPSITGYLAGKDAQWISFVIAGVLKVVYDLLIVLTFALKSFDY
ncbi:uncharacterized protein SAPINGB_P000837 [Magnusiomyces paraingens]|uniref:Major facilitator superfamily (MFS) profile domain-containing protein n=1 Tax=Magnusiomyces paraingens TaxID=2606893 RepID=A0A5E8B386_9ASCO|nr:uncharacterized protein SAPINGB_P000837 [Saprochaete ingens]VVT45680.1 unnamed protein product [Saprochaete ingens]